MQIIGLLIATYLLGILSGKAITIYTYAKKLQTMDELIYEKHKIRPIKELIIKHRNY